MGTIWLRPPSWGSSCPYTDLCIIYSGKLWPMNKIQIFFPIRFNFYNRNLHYYRHSHPYVFGRIGLKTSCMDPFWGYVSMMLLVEQKLLMSRVLYRFTLIMRLPKSQIFCLVFFIFSNRLLSSCILQIKMWWLSMEWRMYDWLDNKLKELLIMLNFAGKALPLRVRLKKTKIFMGNDLDS